MIYNWGRKLIHKVNIPRKNRYEIFSNVFETAIFLDGLEGKEIYEFKQTMYEHYFGNNKQISEYISFFLISLHVPKACAQ